MPQRLNRSLANHAPGWTIEVDGIGEHGWKGGNVKEKPKKYEQPWGHSNRMSHKPESERERLKALEALSSQLDYLIDMIKEVSGWYSQELSKRDNEPL